MSDNVYFFNANNIEIHDNTEDYDCNFRYRLTVGLTADENKKVFVDMLAYINDENEKSDFSVKVWCYDTDEGIIGYITDNNDSVEPVSIPLELQDEIIELTKEAAMKTEIEKISKYCEWFTEGAESISEDAEGLLCFENLGSFNNIPICADFHALVVEDHSILPNHNKGKYYMSPVYNMDGDKAYLAIYHNDSTFDKIAFDMPHDILERCENKAKDMAYRIKCEELHEELYKEYKEGYKDGFDLGSDMRLIDDIDEDTDPVAHVAMDYEEWLSIAYPDEGYFVGHVLPEEAKFLCEHDELINLDYYDLYEKTVRACASLEASDFMDIENNAPYYEVQNPGKFEEQINIWIERSNRPDIIKELCDKYQIEAKDYSEFYSTAAVDVYDYITFEDKGEDIVAHIKFTVDGNDICLNNIPLSGFEQGFVRKAIEEFKNLHPQKEIKHQDNKEH